MTGALASAAGRRLRYRRAAAIAGGLAVAFLVTVSASAGAHSFDQPDRVLVSTSGNNSELVQNVPIGIDAATAQETVVMSLPFGGQPLLDGDGLTPGSELEVTTDCPDQRDSCVGTPYTYTPQVTRGSSSPRATRAPRASSSRRRPGGHARMSSITA